jgi:cyclic peptide transporter
MLILFLRRHRRGLLISFLFSGANATITLVVLSRLNSLISHGVSEHRLRTLSLGLAWLVALVTVGVASQFFLTKFGGELMGAMRYELARRFIDLDFERLTDRKHTVFGALVEDAGRIASMVSLIPQLVYQSFTMALYLVYLAAISRSLFAVLIPAMLVTSALTILLSRLAGQRFLAMRSSEEDVFESYRAIAEGKKEMSLNAQRVEHFTDHVLGPAIGRSQKIMINAFRLVGVNNAISTSASYATILTLAYLGYAEFGLPVQNVSEFVLVALFLAGPIGYLTNAVRPFNMGLASLRHLGKLGLGTIPRVRDQYSVAAPRQADSRWKAIRVTNLAYSYPHNSGEAGYQFGPVDITIQNGEVVFITGENGSGKSTLLLLLCGLLRPTGGAIFRDNRPVAEDMIAYRAAFSGVFGDFFLFPDVIDNRGQSVSDERVLELLGKLGLKAAVKVRDGKLSKLSLSTGQRKRLALLQCYAENRDIWFFDEWAAEQDVQFREFFYCELIPELKRSGKTLLVISHDDRYFSVADRVIRLERGRIKSDSEESARRKQIGG